MVAKTPLSNKELLMEAIESSSSIKECLRWLGLRTSGNVYRSFHKWCKIHEIDESVLDDKRTEEARLKASRRRKYSDDEIFVENSPYKNSIRHRLLGIGFKYECEECGIGGTWNDKPLTLQVEHKNGVHTDNRLENLCFLCPNCHSQTSTYGSKNIDYSKDTECRDCGAPVSKGKPRCEKCCYESKEQITVSTSSVKTVEYENKPKVVLPKTRVSISRDPGKEKLIKSFIENNFVFVRVGKLYGVSDNAVRKWCRKHGIPTRKKELSKYVQEYRWLELNQR